MKKLSKFISTFVSAIALAICPVPINPNFIVKNNYLVMPKL